MPKLVHQRAWLHTQPRANRRQNMSQPARRKIDQRRRRRSIRDQLLQRRRQELVLVEVENQRLVEHTRFRGLAALVLLLVHDQGPMVMPRPCSQQRGHQTAHL
eukprot:CAMPEP_0203941340 /NCGR_PEP_ID=MMETSP0359-20131031/77736_1 /ASSEMBLY_ACC=CAM_ASM_000338 /TAXON_ID=268821 /ORGANISM="Scrippsiella Hangoei, Strain SHTV-5" /LENGTH=102 /DNA_ID=CAMNT_0050871889 /DNA_START=133 /DNA_END=441 /DNA_ORIENTATION=+